MNDKPVVKKCPRCRKLYKLGYNGVVGMCDKCAGIERDENDYIWEPGVSQQTYVPVDGGDEFTVQRPDNLRKEW